MANKQTGLRLMIYDETCAGKGILPGLTTSWVVGGRLYQGLGRLDAYQGVSSWEQALSWLNQYESHHPIDEIQYWGHGKWGCAYVARDRLDASALVTGHPLHGHLRTLRARLSPTSLFWWRTCETYGKSIGKRFAASWSDFLQCQSAGHTYVIGPWQSGLHGVEVGAQPDWDDDEGLPTHEKEPRQALFSKPWYPRTVHCLQSSIPPSWMTRRG